MAESWNYLNVKHNVRSPTSLVTIHVKPDRTDVGKANICVTDYAEQIIIVVVAVSLLMTE